MFSIGFLYTHFIHDRISLYINPGISQDPRHGLFAAAASPRWWSPVLPTWSAWASATCRRTWATSRAWCLGDWGSPFVKPWTGVHGDKKWWFSRFYWDFIKCYRDLIVFFFWIWMGLSPFSSLFCWLNQHEISTVSGWRWKNPNSQVVDVDVALKVVKSTVPHAACRCAQIFVARWVVWNHGILPSGYTLW